MQSINLDIRTLSFVSTTFATFFACGLFAFGALQKEFKGFPLLASAVALFAAGFFFLGYRDIFPDFITIILANLMIIVGSILYYEGTRRFLDHSTRFHPVSVIAIVVGFVLFLYFTYWNPSVNNRIICITAIQLLVSILCVREFSQNLHVSWRVSGFATALVFVIFGFYQLFRLLWTLSEESPIQSFMSAGNVHAFAFITLIILVSGTTFGYIWMANSRLEYNLTELATHDPLTGVFNRRGIDFLASQEIAKIERTETNLTFVMVDIDYFKKVNDQFGHSVGDMLLVEFAKLIRTHLRPYDIFGRLGGEEFLIIFTNTKYDLALTITERIRKEIEDHGFELASTKIQITASFGISNYVPEGATLDKLILFADQALFRSKQLGRNQVSSFSPQIEEAK